MERGICLPGSMRNLRNVCKRRHRQADTEMWADRGVLELPSKGLDETPGPSGAAEWPIRHEFRLRGRTLAATLQRCSPQHLYRGHTSHSGSSSSPGLREQGNYCQRAQEVPST